MNNEPPTPFDTVGDEPVEARIVAWVLGEASAFEAAELERLCEERPELLVFRRRMRALHGLLTEAEADQPDEGWKLPQEKRRALQEVFGEEPSETPPLMVERRIRFSGRRTILAIAACLVVTFFISRLIPSDRESQNHRQRVNTPTRELELAQLGESAEGERENLASIALSKRSADPRNKSQIDALTDSRDQESNDGGSKEITKNEVPRQSLGFSLDTQEHAKAKHDFDVNPQFSLAQQEAPAPTAPHDKPVGMRPASSSAVSFEGQDTGELAYRIETASRGDRNPSARETAKQGQLARKLSSADGPVTDAAATPAGEIGAPALFGDLPALHDHVSVLASAAGEPPSGGFMLREGSSTAASSSPVEEQVWNGSRLGDVAENQSTRLRAGKEMLRSLQPGLASQAPPVNAPQGRAEDHLVRSYDDGPAAGGLEESGKKEAKLSLSEVELTSKLEKVVKDSESVLDEFSPSVPSEAPPAMEETAASEDPYSTFSLNISDASFQLAKSALARGERPNPSVIKPEQFYNAVDYGDPVPSAGQPVAATIEQSAHPVTPGRNLVRVALRVGSTGRSAAQPLRLTLLVDQSGSMVREDRRSAMDHALKQLAGLLTQDDLVTVIGFSRTPHLLADGMPGNQAAKLAELANQTANEGGTNLEEAMKLGAEKATAHRLELAQNRVVLFTDGAANLGDANPDRLAAQVKSLRQQGIAFDVAGIGADGLNDRLLSELARNGNGRYYVVSDGKDDSFARQLAGAFRPAAENVKVQVRFNPQRVGRYQLIGFEKDRLKTEDFRNDAVDAAELAEAEAGVAIYQVEPLPGGSGELGEVSVRFRDMAGSGEMVERTWTMSYDPQASAFDRATPSMQLAGLAMLAAEKLKGGPLAAAIDFREFAGVIASVRQFYGDSARVSDVLHVVDQLK